MEEPAPFVVDSADTTQLLIGTCRVWRGPANGSGWSSANAISPILDTGVTTGTCSGDAPIRAVAALPLAGGGEAIYVGMYGSLNGGANLPGHVLRATLAANGTVSAWTDLTLNPVTNGDRALNFYGLDISSIAIDSHDPTGNTVYVTVAGIATPAEQIQTVYRSTDGGAHWAVMTSNLPQAPANSVVVDPQSASTVYLATDAGVFFTTEIASCADAATNCWSVFGTGLPEAPVVQLIASPAGSATQLLTAGTYGRGIWQTPLWSAATGLTTATVKPATLTFAAQVFGTTSSGQLVTLTNSGNLGLTVGGVLMSGDFAETDNCQNTTVAPSASCTLQVTFTPTALGARTGQMTISANVYGGQLSVGLNGTGTAAGMVTLTPASLSFGEVEVGTTSAALQVEAGNAGSTAVPIAGITVTPPFAIASNACGTTQLAADSDFQITVTFSPTQAGAATGTLTLTDGAGTQTVLLSGTGAAAPTDLLNPSSLTFAATGVGEVSAMQTVTLTNTGDLPLLSIAISVSGPFQITNTCGASLTGHSACAVSVVFAPSQLGVSPGTLTVTDALRSQSVALSGTGVPPPTLSVSPGSLAFAAQALGVTSAPQTVTVSNTGVASLGNVGFQISGPAVGSFSTGATSCGATLAGGASCTVAVTFTPATAGGSVATLTVSSSTVGVTPVTVALSGTAQTAAGLNVSPAQLSFGTVVTGTTSTAQMVTVSNTSSSAATTLTFGVTPGFTVTQNTCAGGLAAGASCALGLSFAPTAVGAVVGLLTVSSASIPIPVTVILAGVGATAAGIAIVPGAINFPVTGVGQMSGAMTLTVTNSGAATGLSGLTLAAPAGFVLVNNTCTATLGPGASCTVGVEFAPAAVGAAAGNLTITATGLSPVMVPLTGTGFDFTLTVSGQSAQTVNSGGSVSYTLAITVLNGVTPPGAGGTFTFACGGLPPYAVCSFNPLSETVNAGASGNVTVEITTKSVSAMVTRPGGWSGMGAISLACGLLLLPLGWKRRRRTLLLVALGLVLVGGATSCTKSGGGTGGGGGGSGGTPPGTFSIPVTATANGLQHSVTVMLTVD
jgi:hypothetical protein